MITLLSYGTIKLEKFHLNYRLSVGEQFWVRSTPKECISVALSELTAKHTESDTTPSTTLVTCPTGKKIIETLTEAEDLVTSLTAANLRHARPEGRTAARCYQCPECDRWHLTSKAPLVFSSSRAAQE